MLPMCPPPPPPISSSEWTVGRRQRIYAIAFRQRKTCLQVWICLRFVDVASFLISHNMVLRGSVVWIGLRSMDFTWFLTFLKALRRPSLAHILLLDLEMGGSFPPVTRAQYTL